MSRARAVLVAISGIDGAGKGHVAHQVESSLAARGVRVAALSVDPCLRLPHDWFPRRRSTSPWTRPANRRT